MNTFGKLFKVQIYGESHTSGVGVLIDNVKPGIALSPEDFSVDLSRRMGGKKNTTPRKETDFPNILSGVFNGYTTGMPILINFENNNTISKDYDNLINHPRPSHADLTYKDKYNGYNDYRGGGSSSGRLTVGITAAGVVAKKIIPFVFETKIIQLGTCNNELEFDDYLTKVKENNDSVGGVVQVIIKDVNKSLGEPFFYSVESAISSILFSIGGVKGVSFGVEFMGARMLGSEYNDMIIDELGTTKTNNNGGINGGITNGNDIIVNVFVKPTPSIGLVQPTYNFQTRKIEDLSIVGRHDPAIIKRALVVLENACAIALCDLYLLGGK